MHEVALLSGAEKEGQKTKRPHWIFPEGPSVDSLLADEKAPAYFLVIHCLGGLLIGVAQPFVVFCVLFVGLGCAFGEPQVPVFQVGRQVVSFQNLKARLVQGLLVGLEAVGRVEEEPVVDEFLGGRADIGLGLDQVVEDHDAA
ncbi:MAG: hypothetical protein J4N87_01460 [Chloroflexi bacterium]|nr:hypothetical protein [Chloroflexota bacterium]